MLRTTSTFIILLLCFQISFSQDQNDTQLAFEYYKNKSYDKAAILYKKIYESSSQRIYFSYYIKCLLELKQYDVAEKTVKKSAKQNADDASYLVELGYVYKVQNKLNETKECYDNAIKKMQHNENQIRQVANAFLTKQEYDYAELCFLEGRKYLTDYKLFHYDLANVYSVQRNFEKMINEYLDMLAEAPEQITNIQNRLQYYITSSNDEDFSKFLKTSLLKRIQNQQDKSEYYEMLVWQFIQEKNFEQAFVHTKALDKRNSENGDRVLNLGDLALSNENFDVAESCYQYVITKGENSDNYIVAKLDLISVQYKKMLAGLITEKSRLKSLEQEYISIFSTYGLNSNTVTLVKELAHLQAFYLFETDSAVNLLQKAIRLPRISAANVSEFQLELADIQLFNGDIWEATMLYAKVENDNKNNPWGSEAKFRKAKLAYYTGNFKWAQAQLDVLKASTSKLIANDALELALIISENLGEDSVSLALQTYANADLLFLQNKDSLAIMTLDTILTKYQQSGLVDDAYMKKAKLAKKVGNYTKALEYYLEITINHSWETLADDATFDIAMLYEKHLNDKDKAMEFYKELMTKFPGSILVVEARKHYRTLRGDVP